MSWGDAGTIGSAQPFAATEVSVGSSDGLAGPELAGRPLDPWAHLNRVELDFSRPGKPTDDG